MTKKHLLTLVAIVCCAMTMTVMTASCQGTGT